MQTFPRVNLICVFFNVFHLEFIKPRQTKSDRKSSSLTRSPKELSLPLTAEARLNEGLSVTKKITVKSGDNLANIFERHEISPGELQKLTKLDSIFEEMKTLLPGEQLHINSNLEGKLVNLKYIKSPVKI